MSIIISEIRIKNFRSLKDLKVKLSPNITLLVGMNNAGKTTFLRALNIALSIDKQFISKEDLFINKNGEELPEEQRIITIDMKIIPANKAATFDEKWLYDFKDGSISTDRNGNEFFAYRTKIDFTKNKYSSQPKRYKIMDWESGNADETEYGELKADISNIPFYFIDAQRDLNEETTKRTSDFGTLAGKVDYDDVIKKELEDQLKILNDKAVKDSPVLKKLRDNLEKLNKTVQNNGKGVEITPFPKKVRDLNKGMKVHFQDGESDSFSLEYHGMGTRSWASLLTFKAKIEQYTDEHNEDNKPFHPSLGLEEPEAHLHPNAQRQVYKQLSEVKGQKIISTHSPYIVQQADLSEIRHFSKEKDFTEVSQINLEVLKRKEINQIKLDIGSSKGEILFSKAVVLCEGETEETALPIFAESYWGKTPYELGVSFIKTGKFFPLIHLLRFLKTEWFIFADYDKPDVKSALKNVLRRAGFNNIPDNVICLNGESTQFDIEEYLYNQGYEVELKASLKSLKEPEYANEKHREAKKNDVRDENERIDALPKEDFIQELDDWKAKAAAIYPYLILERNTNIEKYPEKIRKLFELVSEKLNLEKVAI